MIKITPFFEFEQNIKLYQIRPFPAFVLSGNALPTALDENIVLESPGQISAPYCDGDGMRNSKLDCLGTVFHFIVNVDDLEANCVESPDVMLSGVAWRVKFCKGSHVKEGKDTDVVDFFISSAYKNNEVPWSCEASVVLRLFHKDDPKNNTMTLKLKKQTFSNKKLQLSASLSWDTFLEQYVQDNEATFEIEMLTTPLILKTPSDVEQINTQFQVVLNNVSKIRDIFSSIVIVRGIKWRIHTKIQENETLSIHLQAVDIDLNWSYAVRAFFSILSFKKNGAAFDYKFDYTFSRESPEGGSPNIMSWNEFFDRKNKYVLNDKSILLVKFEVEDPKPLWQPERGIAMDGESYAVVDDEKKLPCCVCHEKNINGEIFSTNCGHLYCRNCYIGKVQDIDQKCRQCGTYVTNWHPVFSN